MDNPVKMAFEAAGYVASGKYEIGTYEATDVEVVVYGISFTVMAVLNDKKGLSFDIETDNSIVRLISFMFQDSSLVIENYNDNENTKANQLTSVDGLLEQMEKSFKLAAYYRLTAYITSYALEIVSESLLEELKNSEQKVLQQLQCKKEMESNNLKSFPLVYGEIHDTTETTSVSLLSKELNKLGFRLWQTWDYVDYELQVEFLNEDRLSMEFCPHLTLNKIDKELSITLGVDVGHGWEDGLTLSILDDTPWGDIIKCHVDEFLATSSDSILNIPKDDVDLEDYDNYYLAAKHHPEQHGAVIKAFNDAYTALHK